MQTVLLHALNPLLRHIPQAQRVLLVQFLRFAAIGTLGFVLDTVIVYALARPLGVYAAGVVSYFIVASINWLLNRIWTYAHLDHGAHHKQLVMFLAANSVGLVLNRGTYAALIYLFPLCRVYLILPVAAGGICGMFVNFFLSRRLVFK